MSTKVISPNSQSQPLSPNFVIVTNPLKSESVEGENDDEIQDTTMTQEHQDQQDGDDEKSPSPSASVFQIGCLIRALVCLNKVNVETKNDIKSIGSLLKQPNFPTCNCCAYLYWQIDKCSGQEDFPMLSELDCPFWISPKVTGYKAFSSLLQWVQKVKPLTINKQNTEKTCYTCLPYNKLYKAWTRKPHPEFQVSLAAVVREFVLSNIPLDFKKPKDVTKALKNGKFLEHHNQYPCKASRTIHEFMQKRPNIESFKKFCHWFTQEKWCGKQQLEKHDGYKAFSSMLQWVKAKILANDYKLVVDENERMCTFCYTCSQLCKQWTEQYNDLNLDNFKLDDVKVKKEENSSSGTDIDMNSVYSSGTSMSNATTNSSMISYPNSTNISTINKPTTTPNFGFNNILILQPTQMLFNTTSNPPTPSPSVKIETTPKSPLMGKRKYKQTKAEPLPPTPHPTLHRMIFPDIIFFSFESSTHHIAGVDVLTTTIPSATLKFIPKNGNSDLPCKTISQRGDKSTLYSLNISELVSKKSNDNNSNNSNNNNNSVKEVVVQFYIARNNGGGVDIITERHQLYQSAGKSYPASSNTITTSSPITTIPNSISSINSVNRISSINNINSINSINSLSSLSSLKTFESTFKGKPLQSNFSNFVV